MITDEIVDVFRINGQPFTSSVPNIVLKDKSLFRKQIQDFARESNEMIDELQNLLFPSFDTWIDSNNWDFAVFQSVRFYLNDDLDQCIIVPKVSLMPVKEDVLAGYGEI